MKKYLCVIGLFFLLYGLVFGYQLTQVSHFESNLVAYNWLQYLNKLPLKDKKGKLELIRKEPVFDEGKPICYVYHLYPKGHILISCYKELVPVKSFSVVSDFDPTSYGYERAVIKELKTQIKFIKEADDKQLEEVSPLIKKHKKAWINLIKFDVSELSIEEVFPSKKIKSNKIRKFLLKGRGDSKIQALLAEPLLRTRWGQGVPFNYFCPLECGNKRTVVGCVATATAQIMKYYKWPKRGKGYHEYYYPYLKKWISADFRDEYEWSYMRNTRGGIDTWEEIEAVAELCYEVGVAVNMQYSTEGSGAYVKDVEKALETFFKYKKEAKVVWRRDYSDSDDWFEVFKEQRDMARPVEAAIYGAPGGHAVVIDGYSIIGDSKMVHINMGWRGHYDAYYSLDYIKKDGFDFTTIGLQHAVINIIPDYPPEPPLNFSGTRVENKAASGSEYIDVLTWEPNPINAERGLNIICYRIYFAGTFLTEVSGDTFKFEHRHVQKDRKYVYYITAVDEKKRESGKAIVAIF